MTYIGSMKDAEKAMSDEQTAELWAQQRLEGLCPEGVEDFAAKWFAAVDPVMPVMSDDGNAQGCAEAVKGFAEKMAGYANAQAAPYLAVPRMVRTEVEILREQLAAQSAELAAAHAALALAAAQAVELTGQTAKAAPAPLAGALRAWSGHGGIDQLTGKPSWV